MAQEALYPFGYGLTYTTFRYDAVPDQQLVYRKDEPVTVCVDVTNTGARDSDECVQLYLSHTIQNARLSPKWSLKGFTRVHMAAGETKRLTFTLTAHELRSVEEDGSRVVESGQYTVSVSYTHLYEQGRHELLNETNRLDIYSDVVDWLEG